MTKTKNEQNEKVNKQGGTAINTRDTVEGRLSELHTRFGTTAEQTLKVEENRPAEGSEDDNIVDVYILKNSDGVEIARGTVEELEAASLQPGEEVDKGEKDAE